MSYNYPEIRQFNGLHLQANSFGVPDGALEIADNVVISKDGIISRRRGFYEYYDPSADTLNNLFNYQSYLLATFSDKIAYFTDTGSSPNYTGSRHTLSGVTVAITSDRVSRAVLANRNLYFSTDNGVLKLEAYNSSVFRSGTPPALDLRGRFYASSGVIATAMQVGWRVAFGRRDANDNLLLGAPSEIMTLTNSTVADVAWTRVTNVVTVTSSNHGLQTGNVIVVSASTGAGDLVVAGNYTVTVTTTSAFTISSTDTDAGPFLLTYALARNTRIEISIPSEITTTADGYFYRLYRSSQVAASSTSIYSDFKLIDEVVLTSAQITAGVAFYNDDVDDILLGEELYTNQNSQEGEAQANQRAPLCDDITLYKGHIIYGACTTRQILSLAIIDTSVISAASYLETSVGSTVRRYVARTGVGNQTVPAVSVTSSSGLLITYTAHGFSNDDSVYVSNITGGSLAEGLYYVVSKATDTFKISATIAGSAVAFNSESALDFQGVRTKQTAVTTLGWVRASNVVTVTSTTHGLSTGMTVYITASSGGAPEVADGLYSITVTTANAFTIASVGADDASGNTLTSSTYVAMYVVDASSSASVQLATTAKGIVRAINRDTSASVYAAYTSGIAQTPGMFQLQGKSFTSAIYVRASAAGVGTGFSPVLPASFSTGTQVYSRGDQLPHTIFSSKINEPEAVPVANQFPIGARNKSILRVLALRDSVIILKEDGVFRLTGDDVFNYTITPVDTTVICVAPSSAVVLNNQVFCLTNQGVCLITESSVQIVSRKIEDVIQPILGTSTIDTVTGAFAYESERFYGVTTCLPNGTAAAETYVYNFLNDSWVTWDELFLQGVIGPSDTMYLVSSGNKIRKERKNQTRLDFTGQNYTVTVSSVASDLLSAVCVFPAAAVPVTGDIINKNDTFSRITDVELVSGTTYELTFEKATNIVAADSVTLYAKYDVEFKLAPFHAGLTGRMKQFAQMQMHFRDASVSELVITFTGDTYGSSETTTWSSILTSAGWGNFPFGFEPWGLQDGINIQRQTSPAPICRIYVPRFQQRGTFIQPDILNSRAGEAINLQALSFSVRAYNERTSR